MSKEIHVAVNGKDTHPGTKARPFATLARAWEGMNKGLYSGDAGALSMVDVQFTRPPVRPAKAASTSA